MQCPIDRSELIMSDRNGVEIDYCPTCRGVWLDRGELDKIIERAAGSAPEPQRDHRSDDRRSEKRHKKSKASSLLGELFDF